MKFDWLNGAPHKVNTKTQTEAQQRQAILTKPPGALGLMEEIAINLAAMQGTPTPSLDKVHIVVFAADHGVASEGISAFPQSVTVEMIRNFAAGGAAISVLAKELDAELRVVNLGTAADIEPIAGVANHSLGPGTHNFIERPAMDEDQLAKAINCGRQQAERSAINGAQLFIGGEMGIGNTTSATAVACALLNAEPETLVGPGTGVDQKGIERKIEVIKKALTQYQDKLDSPLAILRHVGGFEIAALTGAYISAAKIGMPVLIDGFIATVAALAAERICPGVSNWFMYSHASAEPGHKRITDALEAKPLLNFNMRLGEASGAAVAVPTLRLACALHNKMATFCEANVSNKV